MTTRKIIEELLVKGDAPSFGVSHLRNILGTSPQKLLERVS